MQIRINIQKTLTLYPSQQLHIFHQLCFCISTYYTYLLGYLGSILPTFDEQLLRTKIPKVQKDTDDVTVFFGFWGSTSVKDAGKMLVQLTPMVTKSVK